MENITWISIEGGGHILVAEQGSSSGILIGNQQKNTSPNAKNRKSTTPKKVDEHDMNLPTAELKKKIEAFCKARRARLNTQYMRETTKTCEYSKTSDTCARVRPRANNKTYGFFRAQKLTSSQLNDEAWGPLLETRIDIVSGANTQILRNVCGKRVNPHDDMYSRYTRLDNKKPRLGDVPENLYGSWTLLTETMPSTEAAIF